MIRPASRIRYRIHMICTGGYVKKRRPVRWLSVRRTSTLASGHGIDYCDLINIPVGQHRNIGIPQLHPDARTQSIADPDLVNMTGEPVNQHDRRPVGWPLHPATERP